MKKVGVVLLTIGLVFFGIFFRKLSGMTDEQIHSNFSGALIILFLSAVSTAFGAGFLLRSEKKSPVQQKRDAVRRLQLSDQPGLEPEAEVDLSLHELSMLQGPPFF